MVYAFLAVWAFGAVLLLTCSALMWSERISVLRTIPVCARCAYELTGLSRSAPCPECNTRERRFTAPGVDAARSRGSLRLWITPTAFGLVTPAAISVLAEVPAPWNLFGTALNALAFVACALLLRILLRWITRGAADLMMWCSILALTLALAAIMFDATKMRNISATPEQVYMLGPLLTLPFAGYGFAAAIIILSAWHSRRVHAGAPPAPAPVPPMPPPRQPAWRLPRH